MDRTTYNQLSSDERHHPSSNIAGDPNAYLPRPGPGPYLLPPPMQPGRESPRDTLQSNMSGANPGAFWPGHNPPQYLPPPHQTSSGDQRCPPWTPPAPGYNISSQSHGGYRPPAPQPPPRFDGYGMPPNLPHGFAFDPSVPPPALGNYPVVPPQFPPMMNEAQRPLHRGPTQPDHSSLGGPGRRWTGGEAQPTPGGSNVQRTFDSNLQRTFDAYPPTGPPQHSQYGRQPISKPDSSFRVDYPDRGFPEERRPLLGTHPSAPPPRGEDFQSVAMNTQPPDEETLQRLRDEQWLKRFLKTRSSRAPQGSVVPKQTDPKQSVAHLRETLYSAVRLVSKLSAVCDTLKESIMGDESVWADSYANAESVKSELQERLEVLSDPVCVSALKKRSDCVSKTRSRLRQRKLARAEEKQAEEERIAEKEAAIDKWRMKRIHEVEEKKREQELKLAADSVLCEVRKKQSDVKRMLDILRSLEKLRKLRKEAASRKGIFPEPESDQTFDGQVERLRVLIRKRTAVYGAEENALRVMLEGEQEEERRRDLEKRQKKEREKLLQKKREMESMLFGDEMHPQHFLQPFLQYYTQAERSLPALIQIRREWDMCLVPEHYPDGTPVPPFWVVPEPPSDDVWATALDRD